MSSPERDEFQGTARFVVQRRLGAGSFGVVHQVYDKERDTVVALKTLQRVSPEALYYFKNEFRSLADMSHPGLVTLYELLSDGEQWFFTMELVNGVDFLEYVRRRPEADPFARLHDASPAGGPPLDTAPTVAFDGTDGGGRGSAKDADFGVAETVAFDSTPRASPIGNRHDELSTARTVAVESLAPSAREGGDAEELSTARTVAIESVAPPDRLGSVAPSDRLGSVAPPDRLESIPPPYRLGSVAPPDRLGSVAPPDRLESIPPPYRLESVSTRPRGGDQHDELSTARTVALEAGASGNGSADEVFFTPRTRALADSVAVERPPPAAPEAHRNSARARPSFRTSVDIDRLRVAMRQLAEAVVALHQAGKLHRDLKPSNVLVSTDGRVRLLDFGLVLDLAEQKSETRGDRRIVGTPAYVCPEHLAMRPMSEASDWYSVGVMLYEALVGRVPFEGSLIKLLADKQMLDPVPPSRLGLDVPEDLEALCMELLRREPEARPSGAEVLRRLGALDGAPGQEALGRAAPLLGRDRYLAALSSAFEAVEQGRAVALYLHGSSGMGKSSLVRHFLDELEQRRETLVLSGRCYEQESVPYKALDSLIDDLCRYLLRRSRRDLAAILPRDADALARLFPVLRQVDGFVSARTATPLALDPQELRRRAFTALRELLSRLSQYRRPVLFIDDLQWGDLDSAGLLAEILRAPDPPRILFIGCYRTEEVASSPLLCALRGPGARAGSGAEVREVALEALALDEARALVLELLGRDDPAARDTADAIARESGGNPFFVDELVRYVKAGAGLSRDLALSEVLWARLERLPDEARALLEIIAVAGQPLRRSVAKQTAGIGAEEQAVLASLRAGHLIRIRGTHGIEEIEAYHDRIRETVVAHLPPERLRDCHGRLARALEDVGADPETLLVHFQGAGENARAAEYAVEAAEKAALALAFDRAARLYRLALELDTPEGAGASRLREKLAEALVNAGRGAEAAEAYLAASASASGLGALELKRCAAEQLLRSGHIDEGLRVIRELMATMGMKLAESPRSALAWFLVRRAQIRWRGIEYVERDAREISAEEFFRIDTCWAVAMGLGIVDTIRAADFQARHLLLALRAGEPYRIARALAMEVAYTSTPGGPNRARTADLLRRVAALADRIQHPHAIASVALTASIAAFHEGRWSDTIELSDRAERLLRERCKGVAWEVHNAQMYAVRSLYYTGEWGELCRRVPALMRDAHERGDLFAATRLRTWAGYVPCLAADEPDRARAEVEQAILRWTSRGFHHQHYFALVGRTEVALYCGDGAAAWALLEEQWPAFTRSLLPRIQGVLIFSHYLHARAALAAAQAGETRLLRAAERDAARIEREDMPWGAPLVQLIRACIAAARRRKAAAIKLLEAAEAGFDAVHMGLHAKVARRRRGELSGGDRGRALVEEADAWIAGQTIRRADRVAALIAPLRLR